MVHHTKQLKVLAASQYFGFGPTSNLFAILSSIQSLCDAKITLLHNDAIETFSKKNNLPDVNITSEATVTDFDMTISVFDPVLIFQSWLYNIKTFYVCNLFWFWQPSSEHDFNAIIENLSHLKTAKNYELAEIEFRKLFDSDPHAVILMALALATHCFIRQAPNMNMKLRSLGIENKVEYTPCKIILPDISLPSVTERNVVYFQLSGSHTPLSHDKDHTAYLSLINNLVETLSKHYLEFHFIICINPHLLTERAGWLKNRRNIEIIPSVSQKEHFSLLSQSIAIFTSPGLETIFEAVYSNTPIFLLPEQSAGQYKNVYYLQQFGFDPERFLIDEEFPNREKVSGEQDIKYLYKVINDIAIETVEAKHLLNKCNRFLTNIQKNTNKLAYLNMQSSAIKRYMGDHPFVHGETIVNKILSSMGAICGETN